MTDAELNEALEAIKLALNIAYDHGLREFGYDPVKVVSDRLEAIANKLQKMEEALRKIAGAQGLVTRGMESTRLCRSEETRDIARAALKD